MKRGVVDQISEEWLRVILLESEVSHQSLRTWEESNDPEREVKKGCTLRSSPWMPHNPPVGAERGRTWTHRTNPAGWVWAVSSRAAGGGPPRSITKDS